jgi:phage gp45-like
VLIVVFIFVIQTYKSYNMKKIILISLVLSFLVATSCKKDEVNEEEQTTSTTPTVVVDYTADVVGVYTGNGGVMNLGSSSSITITQVEITKLTASSVTVSSPENKFSNFIMTGLVKDGAGGDITNYGTTLSLDFTKSSNTISLGKATSPFSLSFSGSK